MNILKQIIEQKKLEIACMHHCPFQRSRRLYNPLQSLQEKPFIAEIKRASPSAGVLKEQLDIKEQAKLYELYGAGMISVLTDSNYFHGSFENLAEVASTVDLPLLCKDFIVSEKQIDWAYHAGADTILLIAAALESAHLRDLYDYAQSKQLHVLLEIHELEEFTAFADLNIQLLGVNSRNLTTMAIEQEKSLAIVKKLHEKAQILVAESGIERSEDVTRYHQAGARTFLVGSYLMRSQNLKESFAALYTGLENSKPTLQR